MVYKQNATGHNATRKIDSRTLSVIGVGVTLAVWLRGQKLKNRFLGCYVISTLPKLKEMLEGLQVDLRAKFGPLSAL